MPSNPNNRYLPHSETQFTTATLFRIPLAVNGNRTHTHNTFFKKKPIPINQRILIRNIYQVLKQEWHIAYTVDILKLLKGEML